MSDNFIDELQLEFLTEAADLLVKVESLTLDLQRVEDKQEIFRELARLAHNFKGSGAAVGFDRLSKFAHCVEDYIIFLRAPETKITATQLDLLLKGLDRLKQDIETLSQDRKTLLVHDEIVAELKAAAVEELQAEVPQIQSDMQPEVAPHNVQVAESQPVAVAIQPDKKQAGESSKAVQKKNSGQQEVLRIPKNKIDFLLESFGEQVILQSSLDQYKYDLDTNRDLILRTINQLTKLTFELQTHALSLTLIQISPTFMKLERAIRDAAKACNKSVNISVEGGETEVDKTLIDMLSDPLTHMVRNSVDHAVEDSSERELLGKTSHGNVTIRACRTGGQLWIEVEDDGRGLNAEKIKQKAVKSGLISESTAASMSIDEAQALIFHSGLSTKEAVNEISGRGVGMNVVKEAVEKLNGAIEIRSEVGRGTRFRLKLPLSLAIFNGAVIKINDAKFIVPNSEIAEISRYNTRNLTQMGGQDALMKVREEVFRVVDLRTHFEVSRRTKTSSSVPSEKDDIRPVLLTRKNGNCAFIVDEIIGMQKIVQKPLGEEVMSKQEFAAATILSDGTPGVILNLGSLAQAA
jgi:two-component system chemotaxis sensor kinase CheA